MSVPYLSYMPASLPGSQVAQLDPQSAVRAHDIERKAAHRRLTLAMNVADDLERRMGLEKRWEKTDPLYQKALDRVQTREFTRVVDQLEGLVVQRLFELSKANLATTGERHQNYLIGCLSLTHL
jgi:hypothetical protein